jgi:hypothetical protein
MDCRPPSNTSPEDEAAPNEPRHYTREPLWVIPLSGLLAGLAPVVKYGSFRAKFPELALWQGMGIAFGLGILAATVLTASSYVRSLAWSRVVFCVGLLVVTLLLCGICLVWAK